MALYANTATAQTVAADGLVVLAQAVRRGRSASLSGSGVTLDKPNSLYIVSVNARGTTTAAGEFGLAALVDGVQVPAAIASQTTAAAGDQASVAFTFVVCTDAGCCDRPTVTLVNSGDAATFDSVAVTVHRLD